ncbi:MAG: type III secretion system inner membrane ring subunit SctD [Puniceicoccales bacterium]|jgi:type III secretion system YscD/HrpQ family protein|nr:type III secretion system inner membrane ring subunit SctD [Puniceicoccales bacterium]
MMDDTAIEKEGKTSHSFLLRLLSGPHAGAEVELDEHDQEVTIGSDDSCDLVLADVLAARKHAAFRYDGGELHLKPLDGQVFLNGKLVTTEFVNVPAFQFVTIGTTQIVAGATDAEWPSLSLADAPPLEKPLEMPPDTAGDPASIDGSATATQKAVGEMERRKLRRIIFSGIGVLVGGLVVLMLLPDRNKPNLVENEKIIRAEIANLDHRANVDVRVEAGRIIVEGYVPTNAQLRTLKNELLQITTAIQFNVRSEERIIQAIEDSVRDIDGAVRVVPITPGVYSIAGYVHNTERWQRIRGRLDQDIPGVKKINSDIMTPESVQTLAHTTLDEYGLREHISVFPESGRVIFRGAVSALLAEKWRMAAEDIIQTFANIIPVTFDVQSQSAQSDPAGNSLFAQPIQAITIGSSGMSWVTTRDGKKYFEGSFLASGWRIDAIDASGLKFSRNGTQLALRLEALQ